MNPSRIFPLFNDRGTLKVGAPADVALLELREEISSSSTTTRARSPDASGCFRPERCSAAGGSRA